MRNFAGKFVISIPVHNFSKILYFRLLAVKTIEDLLPFVQILFPNISKIHGGTKKDGSFMIQKLVTFDGEIIAYPASKQKEPVEAIIVQMGNLINTHVKEQIVECLQVTNVFKELFYDFSF